MKLVTPHDILSAYAQSEISSSDAIASLGLDGFRELIVAMADAGHRLPRPPEIEVEAQVAAAMPLLLSVLDDGTGALEPAPHLTPAQSRTASATAARTPPS